MSNEIAEERFLEKYTLEEIENMPVLHQGQYDDLLLESSKYRLWRSRLTVDDGKGYNNGITIEKYYPKTGRWETIARYKPIKLVPTPMIEVED